MLVTCLIVSYATKCFARCGSTENKCAEFKVKNILNKREKLFKSQKRLRDFYTGSETGRKHLAGHVTASSGYRMPTRAGKGTGQAAQRTKRPPGAQHGHRETVSPSQRLRGDHLAPADCLVFLPQLSTGWAGPVLCFSSRHQHRPVTEGLLCESWATSMWY